MSLVHNARPIGVFDSGIGGLSVLQALQAALPHEHFVYLADNAHAPYGEKTDGFVRQRTHAITEHLIAEHQIKALVVACNTATAAAVPALRERYALPVVGIEPAVKPAAAATRGGIVGILATSSTLQSRRYAELLERYGSFVRVIGQPCPGLVERVEAGDLEGPETTALLSRYLQPLLDAGADTIVLGCTHYPFLQPLIERLAGPDVRVVDPSGAVARRLQDLLGEDTGGAGSLRAFTTGDAARQSALMSRLFGAPVVAGAITIGEN